MAVAAALAARRTTPPPVRPAQATTSAASPNPAPASTAPRQAAPEEPPSLAPVESPGSSNGIVAGHAQAPERRTHHGAAPGPSAAVAGAPGQRDVKFELMPKGALVSIDGAPSEELFMKVKRLNVGVHVFEAHVPDSKCCESVRREEEIKSDDGAGNPQQVSLSLRFRDALISAPDAPPGAQLSCPILGISGPASGRFPVHMSTFEQDISCNLDVRGAASQRISVTLRAGELITVNWSAPHGEGGVGGGS
jgi:hypothetical protein